MPDQPARLTKTPDNWSRLARAAATDVADAYELPPGARHSVRVATYRALELANGNLPGVLDRARRDGLAEAWRIVLALPPGSTLTGAARAISAAQEVPRV